MDQREVMNKMVEIASSITHGDPTNLVCPYCGKSSLEYSFTVNTPPRYGLFVACSNCGHRQHFSLGEKPPNFREDLVLDKYQRLEDEAIRFAEARIAARKRWGIFSRLCDFNFPISKRQDKR